MKNCGESFNYAMSSALITGFASSITSAPMRAGCPRRVCTRSERTRRLRLGPMGYIVPLYHPLRLAEEIAIVDQMLGGRMELGLVPGINPDYFRPFGLDYGQRKSPTLEFVDYMRAAFGETQPFSHHGQEFPTDNARISVMPAQRPHPPLWLMSRAPQRPE